MTIPTNLTRDDFVRLIRKGQRAEAMTKARKGCLSALVKLAGRWLGGGYWLMLAVGIVHAEWIPRLPTLGYWWAVLIAALLRMALSEYVPPKKTKES